MEAEIQAVLALIGVLRDHEITVRPLGGGLTNRNYRIDFGDHSYVLRIPGAKTDVLGIDRRQEAACARAAADAGAAPEVIAFLEPHLALLCRFVKGTQLTSDLLRQPDMLRRVAQTLRRLHDHGVPDSVGTFSPFDAVRTYHTYASTHPLPLPLDVGPALDGFARIEQELRGNDPPCLCHNDLLPANFIDDGTVIRIIDWEYGGLGDRFFDLGNLAVNSGMTEEQERLLLDSYFDEARPEHMRRLQWMRLVSDMREAMWGFVQADISRLHEPAYYLDYGRKHLDRFLAGLARL